MDPYFEFGQFYPAAWIEVVVCFLEEGGPVFESAGEHADMDVVVFASDPFIFGIFNQKLDVRRNPYMI